MPWDLVQFWEWTALWNFVFSWGGGAAYLVAGSVIGGRLTDRYHDHLSTEHCSNGDFECETKRVKKCNVKDCTNCSYGYRCGNDVYKCVRDHCATIKPFQWAAVTVIWLPVLFVLTVAGVVSGSVLALRWVGQPSYARAHPLPTTRARKRKQLAAATPAEVMPLAELNKQIFGDQVPEIVRMLPVVEREDRHGK